jgi:hypothetical protein
MRVLLVHGMGRTPLSFRLLAKFLRQQGYPSERLGYVAAFEGFCRIQSRVRQRLERLSQTGEPYVVLGHSLGGLALRAALPVVRPAPLHLIMLGTPNQSPRLARRLHRLWLYRLLCGESGQLLASPEFFAGLPLPQIPYTIIAGSAGFHGRWNPFGSDENDRLVAVEETRITPTDRPVVLDVGHTFMMNHAKVWHVIAEVLAQADGDRR